MEHAVEILKYLSSAIAILAPLLKLFQGSSGERHKELQERYERIKNFFDEGGLERHPLLVEAAFAAAMGSTKLSATEIAILLRQKRPTRVIDTYVKVRDYLQPNESGTRLELRSIASVRLLRRALVGLGVVTYVVLVLGAVSLVFFVAPKLALAGQWQHLLADLSLALLFAGMAAYVLLGASHLHWAAQLQARQSDA